MGIIAAFHEGGFMMYPILLLGVAAVAIFFERTRFLFFRAPLNKEHFFKNITAMLLKGDLEGMILVCDQNPTPLSMVVKNCMIRLVNRGTDEEIQAALDEGAITEVPKLERWIGYLAVIGNVATLMGLLGTITGLIRSFAAVANADAATKAAELTKGISEAMNCTAFGLLVAVPAVLAYSVLQNRAQRLIDEINEISIRTFNFILANRERFGVKEG
ncbi:MAG: MotA/TolQ/ExbB proton channel family protein, partial [Bdellovibrionales bacterium]|nr:MotA/TolQ/ExbB proton channel family protein [Bdellovibrionales bacterium]